MQEVKIGETIWFGIGIDQGKEGLIFDLKAHPKIEEYFRSLATTTSTFDQLGGKSWFDPKGVGLQVYKIPSSSAGDGLNDGFSFSFPGYGMNLAEEVGGGYGEYSNISFLRLTGISQDSGIQLGVKGIVSLGQRRSMAKNLTNAVRKFVRGYINTARVEFRLVGREVGVSYTKDW